MILISKGRLEGLESKIKRKRLEPCRNDLYLDNELTNS
jgi:hypothetical protein